MNIEKEMLIFCENVREIRLKNNLSKKEMAKILGIGVGSLNLIEKGIIPERLSAEVIVNICINFKVSASSLFEG